MTIKHDDIIISKENPFENCKLNRQIYASILSDIISSYREGFVLSINGQWGSYIRKNVGAATKKQ